MLECLAVGFMCSRTGAWVTARLTSHQGTSQGCRKDSPRKLSFVMFATFDSLGAMKKNLSTPEPGAISFTFCTGSSQASGCVRPSNRNLSTT